MKGLRKSLAVIVAAVLLLTLVPAVALAQETDTVTGTFSVNDPPSVTYVKLYDTETSPAETTSMTPQVEYDARVKVSDADGLTDLNTIVVKIYFDNTAGTDEAEFDGIATGDAQNQIIITWTEGGTFVLTEEAGSSWDLGICVKPGALDNEFQFKFTVGKVATEATGADGDRWQVAAKVTDDASQTDWDADTTEGASMAWYGEVAVGPAAVDFGSLTAGTDFGTSTKQSVTPVTYISNGAYDEKVKSNASWGALSTLDYDTGGETYDPPCDAGNEFALKADDTATLPGTVLGVVDTTGVIIDNTDGQTTEAGDEVITNNLWLKVGSPFTSGTYSGGTITYIIAAHA